MLQVFKVSEGSLRPAYRDGDFVLISKIPVLFDRLGPGDVVVFHHAQYGTLIKQIEWLDRDRDEIYVVGLVEESIDSRRFGPIHFQDVVGKVILHFPKPSV